MEQIPTERFSSMAREDGGLTGLHICIVIAALGAGGAERVVSWLARRWTELGLNVTIVSFDAPDEDIYHPFPDGVRFARLGVPAIATAGSLVPPVLRRVAALRRAMKELSPDITVSFLTKINVLALIASVGLGCPVVVCERNNPVRQPAHPFWRYASGLLYRRAAAIVCQTRKSIQCVPPGSRRKVAVIPNPVVPMLSGAYKARERYRLVSVGRMDPQKGFDVLIDAFAMIADRHPRWSLDLWGKGHLRGVLQARTEKLGLADRINFRGLSDRPGSWLHEADAFALASRYEGFPNVLGEAMAFGLPVVSTDCDFGPSELVTHGADGLLVPPEDPDALARALDGLLGDAQLRRNLGAQATNVSRRFSPEAIGAKWDEVVLRCLAD